MNKPLYYLFLNNQQTGPYTFGQVQAMWKSGAVTAQTQYWMEGQAEWEQLVGLADLFDKPVSQVPTRQAAMKPAETNSKIKERPKWWIVSTHVLTSSFAIPFVAMLLAAVLIGVIGRDGPLAIAIIILFNLIGYVGGTYYSISYLGKSSTTADWKGCIVPSIVANAIFTIGILICFHPFPIVNSVTAVIDMVAFSLITTDGFKQLNEN